MFREQPWNIPKAIAVKRKSRGKARLDNTFIIFNFRFSGTHLAGAERPHAAGSLLGRVFFAVL